MSFSDVTVTTLLYLGILISASRACSNESLQIGVCLHTYLERDFPAIESIVFPPSSQCVSRSSRPLLLSGQELEQDCNHLENVVNCFARELHSCYYIEDFLSYRHLIVSLEKIHRWLCIDTESRQEHFVVLLKHLCCIEEVSHRACPIESVTKNIWNQIIRLEVNNSICDDLYRQRNCMIQRDILSNRCDSQAQQVYGTLSHMFLESWCSNAHKLISASSTLAMLILAVAVL